MTIAEGIRRRLHLEMTTPNRDRWAAREALQDLLSQDLGFHGATAGHGLHNLHAFPAKFPPQLPRAFIEALTRPGDTVLDPMFGSGTTVIEALVTGRRGIGCDLDPIARMLCAVKSTPVEPSRALEVGQEVADRAQAAVRRRAGELTRGLETRFDARSRAFVDYWFAPETQLELMALVLQIEALSDPTLRRLLALCLSAIIITKSGGVTLARDLAHTRPHRVTDKHPRPAIPKFRKCVERTAKELGHLAGARGSAAVLAGDAEALPLGDATVDLLVTSPPYASNAIDYMRAHKFSLVWLGHPIGELSRLRGRYIGGERTTRFPFVPLPPRSEAVVARVADADVSKGLALHRYYSEMTRVLAEAFRVLKPGKAAVLVVGPSVMRGIDTRTHACIGEIAQSLGFELVGIAQRQLDRNRRMMPARAGRVRESQIEQRMHEEYVVGLVRPAGAVMPTTWGADVAAPRWAW